MNKQIVKKILLSLASISAAGVIAFGATQAFFSDTETSKGNVLVAGEIDLKVDNTCYYNGNACVEGKFEGTDVACDCTWKPEDLTDEHLFFDLHDIKPGDWEEDTISLVAGSNDAWLCADVKLTSDDDNTCTDPENEDEGPGICQDPGPGLGELADAVDFIWWADDGDNVLETCRGSNVEPCVEELPLPAGPMGALDVGETATVALADSNGSIWPAGGPVPGGETRYIGKGWCFGDLTETPVAQDGSGATGTNGPNSPRGGGFTCDGSSEDNKAQTDSFTSDISFRAVQARHNDEFVCRPPHSSPSPSPTASPTPSPSPSPTASPPG